VHCHQDRLWGENAPMQMYIRLVSHYAMMGRLSETRGWNKAGSRSCLYPFEHRAERVHAPTTHSPSWVQCAHDRIAQDAAATEPLRGVRAETAREPPVARQLSAQPQRCRGRPRSRRRRRGLPPREANLRRARGARSFLASTIASNHRRGSALTLRFHEEACEWLFISHYLYQRYWCPSIVPMVLLALSVPLYSVGTSARVTLSKRQQVSDRCGSRQPCLSVKAP